MKKNQLCATASICFVLSASAVEAKISRCTDHNGHITYSDSGCPWNKPGSKPVIDNTNKPINSAIRYIDRQVRRIHFYCHEGAKAFTKC